MTFIIFRDILTYIGVSDLKISSDMFEKAVVNELSVRLKDYRIAKNLTRKDLADKAMLSESTIKRFENGGEISLSNFVKLMGALGLTNNLDLLITDQENRPSLHIREYKRRQRASKHTPKATEWKWGDED